MGNYSYGNSNPYQTNQINNVNQVYDNNGNLTNDTQRAMVYDYQDRLSSVNVRNQTTNYYYDHSKTRVAKLNSQTGAYTEYPNKYFEKSNNKKDWYIFLGNQRLGIFEATTTSALLLNFTDHLNSASITTDSQGNVTNLNDYLPYGGDRINIKNSTFNPTFKFTDQELDSDSGIYYFGSRFYNQNIGRFIQQDPLQLYLYDENQLKNNTSKKQADILQNPQLLNGYSYSVNNPIKFVDNDGQIPILAALVIALPTMYVIGNTLWDLGNVALSSYYFAKDRSGTNAAYLAGDLIALSSPILFGGFGAMNKSSNQQISKFSNQTVHIRHITENHMTQIKTKGFDSKSDIYGLNMLNSKNRYVSSWYYKDRSDKGDDFGIVDFNIPINIYRELENKKLIRYETKYMADPLGSGNILEYNETIFDKSISNIINQYMVK